MFINKIENLKCKQLFPMFQQNCYLFIFFLRNENELNYHFGFLQNHSRLLLIVNRDDISRALESAIRLLANCYEIADLDQLVFAI